MISLPTTKITLEEITAFQQTVIDSVDIEYQRYLDVNEAHRVFDYLLELYTSTNYYAFFTLANIVNVADYVFDNPYIRRYILNVTDRVLLQWPMEERLALIIDHVADRYSRTKQEEESAIMPKEIKASLATNKEVLKTCMTKDVWLLIVFYISLSLHTAKIYQLAIK